MVGLVVGVVTGVFFGELVADSCLVGNIFVKLLQITVLPYIMFSSIVGFGCMHVDQAKRLALRRGVVLLVIWAMALARVFLVALALPDLEVASFFSSAVTLEQHRPDLFELYLPANIIYPLLQY